MYNPGKLEFGPSGSQTGSTRIRSSPVARSLTCIVAQDAGGPPTALEIQTSRSERFLRWMTRGERQDRLECVSLTPEQCTVLSSVVFWDRSGSDRSQMPAVRFGQWITPRILPSCAYSYPIASTLLSDANMGWPRSIGDCASSDSCSSIAALFGPPLSRLVQSTRKIVGFFFPL